MIMNLGLVWLVSILASSAPAQEIDVPAGKSGNFPGYLPAGASKEKPVPLLVACHGHGDTAKNFLACLKPLADASHIALLAPEGVEKVGNDGYGWNNFPDRGKTIEGAIRSMLKNQPIDPKRIVWLGHSAGSWVCCADAIQLPDLCHGLILTAAPTVDTSAGPKGARPKVCLFIGTKDPNFQSWAEKVKQLKAAKSPYMANRVTDLEHAMPEDAYLAGGLAWVLGAGTEQMENTLPKSPGTPEDRGCRHLLVRFKGAEGASADVKRSEPEALKEAERHAGLLRKEKADKRAEHAEKSSEAEGAKESKGVLTKETVDGFGPGVRWACWTLAPGEVRVVRSSAGFHVVWSEK
jgi:predicted esterase